MVLQAIEALKKVRKAKQDQQKKAKNAGKSEESDEVLHPSTMRLSLCIRLCGLPVVKFVTAHLCTACVKLGLSLCLLGWSANRLRRLSRGNA